MCTFLEICALSELFTSYNIPRFIVLYKNSLLSICKTGYMFLLFDLVAAVFKCEYLITLHMVEELIMLSEFFWSVFYFWSASFSTWFCLANVRLQDAAFDIKLPRRSLLVKFTCNLCGSRSEKLVNRLAYERGTVFVQVFVYWFLTMSFLDQFTYWLQAINCSTLVYNSGKKILTEKKRNSGKKLR